MDGTQAHTAVANPTPLRLKSTVNYNEPSLPTLLTNYGFQDKSSLDKKKEKQEDKRASKEQKKAKKKTDSFDDAEDERALMREKEKEEHYLKLVKDLYRLRDYYYREYSSLLGEKVEKQRREIRQRDIKLRSQQEREEEEKKKASHTVRKRLERHTLATTPATHDVPKTDIYHIVGLEDKLRKEGKLRTPTDFNKFREDIEEPKTFYQTFKVKRASDQHSYQSSVTDRASVHSHVESQENIFSMAPLNLEDKELAPRTLSRISESRETARGGPQIDHWAITQQYQARHRQKRRSLVAGRKSFTDTQNDLDKRFPKLEMPKLHCFTMDLAKKPPDPEELRQQAELRAREKQRKRAIRTYTKMYQLAMSNAAVSNRILDQHEDMDMIINGPDLCDVIADHHWMAAYGLREIQPGDNVHEDDLYEGDASLPAIQAIENNGVDEMKEEPERSSREQSAVSSKRSQSAKAKSRPQSTKTNETETETKTPPMPLTMTEIKDKCNIVEAKTLSTLWTNYLGAGK